VRSPPTHEHDTHGTVEFLTSAALEAVQCAQISAGSFLANHRIRVGALFILFHTRVCGPLANSLFQPRPEDRSPQPAKIERAYHEADTAVQRLIDLLAA